MKKIPGSDRGKLDVDGISRRSVLGGAAFVVGVGASGLMMTTASAKTAQKDAMYQDKPKGSSKCSGCMQFEEPDGCKVVEGKISPEGWCQLFSPKA